VSKQEKVYGPFPHGSRWRVVRVINGKQRAESFATRKQADVRIALLSSEHATRTIGEAVAEYLEHGRRFKSLKPSTLTTLRFRLHAILRLPAGNRPLRQLTPRLAQELYDQRVAAVKPDTHRGELVAAKAFGAWVVEAGYLDDNPISNVRPEGQLSTGKPTLKLDAARAFVEAAIAERSEASLACLTTLILGLRASELISRCVADLDDRGSILRITAAKTKAGIRRLRLPPKLRTLIVEHVEGKAQRDRIFNLSRYALYYHALRLCRVARVPPVSPHGLRGTLADTAVEVGTHLDALLPALGWEGATVARRHYLKAGTEQSAQAANKERDLWVSDGVTETDG